MKVLICGSRNFTDQKFLFSQMDELHRRTPITTVIEGEAQGADTLGRFWAEANNIPVLRFPADWDKHGRAAGPIRNKQMLVEGKPDLVVEFSYNIAESRGTTNMLTQAKGAGVPTMLFGS